MARKPGRPGQPTKYKRSYCQDIVTFAEQGKLPIKWSKELMVSQSTFAKWREAHPEFLQAWGLAKDIAQDFITDIGIEADNAVDLAKAKFFLSAAFQVSETNKQEIKSEINSTVTEISMDFGDRDDADTEES